MMLTFDIIWFLWFENFFSGCYKNYWWVISLFIIQELSLLHVCVCEWYFSHNIDTHCVDTGNNSVNMSRVSVSCLMSNLWPGPDSDLQATALNLN